MADYTRTVYASSGRVPTRMVDVSVLSSVLRTQDEIGRRIQDRDAEHHTGGEEFLARVERAGWPEGRWS